MIEFLQDFRGKLTKEHYYTQGTVVALDEATEQALVAEGRAKFVEVLQDLQPVVETPTVKRGRKAKL